MEGLRLRYTNRKVKNLKRQLNFRRDALHCTAEQRKAEHSTDLFMISWRSVARPAPAVQSKARHFMKTKYHIKERIVAVKLGQLKEDFSIYPRADVDAVHTSHITEAMRLGVEMPHIVVEDKTWRIIDGMHRKRALCKLHGDKKSKDLSIRVIARTYASDKELFLDASSLNASHGRCLTQHDKKHAMLIAATLGIAATLVATALNTTVQRVTEVKTICATTQHTRIVTPLKTPIRHMAGREITEEQAEAIPRLGGNQQMFYVNQLLLLIDTGMLDRENEPLMEKLQLLAEKIEGVLQPVGP